MGLLMSYVKRFNIENRAYKQISKAKPDRAPLTKKTEEQLDIARKVDPKFLEKHYSYDENLKKSLSQIYIKSSRNQETQIDTREDPNKLLPRRTFGMEINESPFYQENRAIPGKCSLLKILEFLGHHAENPDKYNAETISDKYKLDKATVESILKYYQIFSLHYIEKGQVQLKFPEPSDLDKVRDIYNIKSIASGDNVNKDKDK